jgi:hypothetical protein
LPGFAASERPCRIGVPQRGLLFGEGTPVATRDVFSEDELAQLRGFPEPARAELIRYFTLAPADEAFVRKFRGQDNVIGVAVQLCTLPWLGFVPDDVAAAPAVVVARAVGAAGRPGRRAARLGVPVTTVPGSTLGRSVC